MTQAEQPLTPGLVRVERPQSRLSNPLQQGRIRAQLTVVLPSSGCNGPPSWPHAAAEARHFAIARSARRTSQGTAVWAGGMPRVETIARTPPHTPLVSPPEPLRACIAGTVSLSETRTVGARTFRGTPPLSVPRSSKHSTHRSSCPTSTDSGSPGSPWKPNHHHHGRPAGREETLAPGQPASSESIAPTAVRGQAYAWPAGRRVGCRRRLRQCRYSRSAHPAQCGPTRVVSADDRLRMRARRPAHRMGRGSIAVPVPPGHPAPVGPAETDRRTSRHPGRLPARPEPDGHVPQPGRSYSGKPEGAVYGSRPSSG